MASDRLSSADKRFAWLINGLTPSYCYHPSILPRLERAQPSTAGPSRSSHPLQVLKSLFFSSSSALVFSSSLSAQIPVVVRVYIYIYIYLSTAETADTPHPFQMHKTKPGPADVYSFNIPIGPFQHSAVSALGQIACSAVDLGFSSHSRNC